MADKMLLVDGHSLMYRAFHALPVMTNDEGVYTNAVHGFLMMLIRVITDEKPDRCAVAFDRHAPTFRHEKYDAYKAGRAPMPDELRPQFDTLRAVLTDMHIPLMELDGYEADDMIGTMSRRCEEKGIECLIITGDRDAFQLAGPMTTILYTRTGIRDTERVTPAFIREKWELSPAQLIDMKGLMGDASDNIPGISGIGEKTAQKLIARYGSLEAVLERAEKDQRGKLRERLVDGRSQAVFSKWLATINRDAPLAQDPDDCRLHGMRDALALLHRLQLRQVAARIEALGEAEEMTIAADLPQRTACEVLYTQSFEKRLDRVTGGVVAIAFGAYCTLASSCGVHIAMPLGGDLINPGASESEAVRMIQPVIDRAQQCVVHDQKRLMKMGLRFSCQVFDVMLAGYLINPQRRSFCMTALCADASLKLDQDFPAQAMLALCTWQKQRLKADGMTALFNDVEMPLSRVLYDMEMTGVLVDAAALQELDVRFSRHIDQLMNDIHAISGDELNVNSPRQLSEYLFGTLGLKGGKKTKTGWSTSADVLEAIQDEHPVVGLVLEYRKYAKLKSTYIDALLRLKDREGRIHTSFDQTATVTGRISSLEPNLQNIPVRTELGRELRRAFIAPEGKVLVDADYSQIELRVLAHMSGDEVMTDAFRRNQDIHARTASEVYGVPLDQVTHAMRSGAKAVNFGIVYGISDFGLAQNIGVSRAEAADFIRRYFDRYPKIKLYMDRCVAEGAAQGFVSTMMGRRRYLPEMADKSYAIRQFGERAAMNSPIQGTAADIIKLAMIRVCRAMKDAGLQGKLILQVHDELIVESPAEEAEACASLIKNTMETVVSLDVPLVAEVNTGRSWYDCKQL